MSGYIPFTDEQRARANSVDLEEFLRSQGERLIPSGRDKRLGSDHSVTVRGSSWYDHAAEHGGGPVEFVERFYRKSYPEAVTILLGGAAGIPYPVARPREERPKKPFELPKPNSNMRRVFAYLLKERNISKDVVQYFAKARQLYEEADHHNCVFVGMDEKGVARHAHMRSTRSGGDVFRLNIESSNPCYSFHHRGGDNTLFVFEAPIDMLSFMTMYPDNWKQHNYVACCGTSSLPVLQMLNDKKNRPSSVYLCLDNDEAGHKASQRMAEQLKPWSVDVERLVSIKKDWNEDLKETNQEVVPLCQIMC